MDYYELIVKMKEDSCFQEFERLANTCNRANKNSVLKIKAFQYKVKYKYTDYKISICKKEDYKLFIDNLEHLISGAINRNKHAALELLYNFLLLVNPALQKDSRSMIEITANALVKTNFEEWVRQQIEELKDKPPEIMKYLIHTQIKDVEGPVWEDFRKIKEKLMKDKKVTEKNVETLVGDIEGYYEAFRIVSGMLIGLLDLLEGFYDEQLERSYFGTKFNTDLGFYSRRKIQKRNRLKDDNRPTLELYFAKYGCIGFQDFFNWLMKTVKPIRLTGAHHKFLIEQEGIDQLKYKIKYARGTEEVDIAFLLVCKEALVSFLTLIYWVVSYFFYEFIA